MKSLLSILACILCGSLFAAGAPALSVDDDADRRVNPGDPTGEHVSHASYAPYPFLDLARNRIELNGADWSDLRGRFDAADDTVVAIVHIGDSHIQAEGATSVTRRRLQQRYGSAGRGLIIPFRAAGTNQPVDYTITFSGATTTSKLLKQPWATEMGFTGISVQPHSADYSVKIALRPDSVVDEYFDYVKVFGHGRVPTLEKAVSDRDGRVSFTTQTRGDTLDIWLEEPVMDVDLHFRSNGTYDFFGFKLENSMMGLEYSAIGNNGATYSSYNAIGSLASDLQALSPNLVIISLGTNEAFGNITDAAFYSTIDLLVSRIRRYNPSATILLVTPAECQRSIRRRTKAKRRARTTTTYAVNTNVKRLRDVILRYGRDKHIATYDWYAAAGGDGSSAHWLDKGLLNTDRIHLTWKGYALQGDLLHDALLPQIAND